MVLDQEYVYGEAFSTQQIIDNDKHSLDSNIFTILNDRNTRNLDFDLEARDIIEEY